MKTHPITLREALRSMRISCLIIWYEYRSDRRERARLERPGAVRSRRRPHAVPVKPQRQFEELKSPAWLAAIAFAIVVAAIDVSDAWPLVSTWWGDQGVPVLASLVGGVR